MIRLPEMIALQKEHVEQYRKTAAAFIEKEISIIPQVLGVLLTGSTARGDARKGPLGLMTDITIVLEPNTSIDLIERFGPSVEPPDYPFHAINRQNTTFALELTHIDSLWDIKKQSDSIIFAKQESLIMLDRTGKLKKWKDTAFKLNDDEIKQRSLMYYRWFEYISNEYHFEKWAFRKAWIQLTHNLNVACECFCSFLFCINGGYVPRRDWIVYLTYELPEKPNDYEQLIHSMYQSLATEADITNREAAIKKANQWMISYCRAKGWMS
jgi:hypothetical protein